MKLFWMLQVLGTGILVILFLFSATRVVNTLNTNVAYFPGNPDQSEVVNDNQSAVDFDFRITTNIEDQFSTIISRPLFMPNRRPHVAVLETPEPTAPQVVATIPTADPFPEHLTLSGVLYVEDRARALILGGSDVTSWWQVGDAIAGWTIIAIKKSEVVLLRDEREHLLEFNR